MRRTASISNNPALRVDGFTLWILREDAELPGGLLLGGSPGEQEVSSRMVRGAL